MATEKTTTAKSANKAKNPPSHPSFSQMISEAIISLKERRGSSQYAISKFIEEKHKKSSSSSLPANFKKVLLLHLKKLVSSGKLTKVKNSYKLAAAKNVSKPAAASKRKATPVAKAGEVKAKKEKKATKKTEKKKKATKRVKLAKNVPPKKAKK